MLQTAAMAMQMQVVCVCVHVHLRARARACVCVCARACTTANTQLVGTKISPTLQSSKRPAGPKAQPTWSLNPGPLALSWAFCVVSKARNHGHGSAGAGMLAPLKPLPLGMMGAQPGIAMPIARGPRRPPCAPSPSAAPPCAACQRWPSPPCAVGADCRVAGLVTDWCRAGKFAGAAK